MKKIIKTKCILLLAIAGLASCNKDANNVFNINMVQDSKKGSTNDITVLGKHIEDPYNIKHMREALEEMRRSGQELPLNEINPTGVYVRVLVDNLSEMDNLHADSNIAWFDYPLDYEIEYGGSYYQDTELEGTDMSWQYGVLPIGYQLPEGIVADTIHYIFIPDEHPEYFGKENLFDLLEDISFKLCGMTTANSPKSSKWTPSASITAYDDLKNVVPMQGVRIKAHNTGKTAWAITDANGNCTFDTQFKDAVTYTIDWSRNHWRIVQDTSNSNTYLNGPTQKTKWIKNIGSSDGIHLLRATIHRAALISNYGSNWTIRKPYDTFAGDYYKLKIRANYSGTTDGKVGMAKCNNSNYDFNNADIIIWGLDQGNNRTETQILFGGTIHELAHVSHCLYMRGFWGEDRFSIINAFIKESWAFCVEWQITNDQYSGLLGTNGFKGGHQNWISPTAFNYQHYTPVFVDLIDNYNQHTLSSEYCNDLFSGATLLSIQNNYIKDAINLQTLVTILKNTVSTYGLPESYVDDLVHNYTNPSYGY